MFELPLDVVGVVVEFIGARSAAASCLALTSSSAYELVTAANAWEDEAVALGCIDRDPGNWRRMWVAAMRRRYHGVAFEGPIPTSMMPLYEPRLGDHLQHHECSDMVPFGFGHQVLRAAVPSIVSRFIKGLASVTGMLVSGRGGSIVERRRVFVTGIVGSGVTTLCEALRAACMGNQREEVRPYGGNAVHDVIELPGGLELMEVWPHLQLLQHINPIATCVIVLVSGIVRDEQQLEEVNANLDFWAKQQKQLHYVPFLLLVSHQDAGEALPPESFVDLLQLPKVLGCLRPWAVFGCSLLKEGVGVNAAIAWLVKNRLRTSK